MKKVKYDGTDFSKNWRVSDYSGKTLTITEKGRTRKLAGFSNFNDVAAYAAIAGGVPVRE